MRLKLLSIMLVTSSTSLCTAPARAQICAGFPTVDRQFSFGANLYLPEDATQLGAEASYNFAGPIGMFGGVSRLSVDDSDTDFTVYTGGAAFDFAIAGTLTRPFFSICPLVQIDYAKEGDLSVRSIPIGVGVGSSFPLAAGGTTSLMPYIIPAIVFTRVSVEDGDSDSESDFGLRGGVLIGFARFFVGGEVIKLVDSGSSATFGIRAGIRL